MTNNTTPEQRQQLGGTSKSISRGGEQFVTKAQYHAYMAHEYTRILVWLREKIAADEPWTRGVWANRGIHVVAGLVYQHECMVPWCTKWGRE